jgi:hypothetical protein
MAVPGGARCAARRTIAIAISRFRGGQVTDQNLYKLIRFVCLLTLGEAEKIKSNF